MNEVATAAKPLKVFNDDYEWYAAHDYEDLAKVIEAFRGSPYDPSDYGGDPIQDTFSMESPETKHKVWIDPETNEITEQGAGVLTTKTNAEWVAQFGRGFLWATEG